MTGNAPAFHHVPVMLTEVLTWLSPRAGGTYADGTLGGGGHSQAILETMQGTGQLYGIDRDEAAIQAATQRLKSYAGFTAVHGNFHDIRLLLPQVQLDGGLLDLGVSSHQLDTRERGFSYHEDAPLDMRMDTSRGQTAAEWLATVTEKEFAAALKDYSDEKWAARIAKVLLEKRAQAPLLTTQDLVKVVDAAIPKAVRRQDTGHPARRTFQAVRIAVNEELAPLQAALDDWMDMMVPGGRLVVITFHSIEDRLVKQAFQRMRNPCVCPPKAPICICKKKPVAKVLAGGAVLPTAQEIAMNPRAQSAKLRVAEKL